MPDKISEVNVSSIKQLNDSVGWNELKREMLLMIEDLRNLLEASDEEAELNRGRINGIRTILAWPDVILEEAKSREDEPVVSE